MARISTETPPYPRWMRLFLVFVFFSCVSFSIILPTLAPYLNEELDAPTFFLAYTLACFSLGEAIGSLLFGCIYNRAVAWSRSKGPPAVLCATISCGILGSFLYVAAAGLKSPWMVFWGRLITGVWTGGKQTVEQSFLAENAPKGMTTAYTTDLGSAAVLGFVFGPCFGAMFSAVAEVSLFGGALILNSYTWPGVFMGFVTVASFIMSALFFRPPEEVPEHGGAGGDDDVTTEKMPSSPIVYSPVRTDIVDRLKGNYGALGSDSEDELTGPDSVGLGLCLFIFFVHFYSFSIQETIATPFVMAAYSWNVTQVNLLFVGAGLVSLVTSLVVRTLAKTTSDSAFIVGSLVIGAAGSFCLVDSFLPGTDGIVTVLPVGRFLAGFALLTAAFPLGRNSSLAAFSRILGPFPQGVWVGITFAVGAIPRILGPFWALYALELACVMENIECWLGGRTWLEFGTLGVVFAVSVVLVLAMQTRLLPYAERVHDRRSTRFVI